MRGPPAIALVLLLAGLSGCVSLVEDDPDAQAALAEAEQALEDYAPKTGHIAGTVTSAVDGLVVTTASVDVLGIANDLTADAQGRFVVLDLAPGTYELLVSAPDFLEQSLTVDVAAGQFSRPAVVLEAVPDPEPYYTVYRLDGFAELGTPFFGAFSCYCYMDGELDEEGLTEILIEGTMDPSWTGAAPAFDWMFEAYSEANEDWTYASGSHESSPMRVSLLAEEIVAQPSGFYLHAEPSSGLLLPAPQQAFTVVVSAFYYGAAAEDYTGLGDE